MHLSVSDIAILVHGYEQDEGVNIVVCWKVVSVPKQGRLAIELFFSLRRLIICVLAFFLNILLDFFLWRVQSDLSLSGRFRFSRRIVVSHLRMIILSHNMRHSQQISTADSTVT